MTHARTVDELRSTFEGGVTKPLAWRLGQLRALRRVLTERSAEFEDALLSDLAKSPTESQIAELGFVVGEIDHTLKHLRRWLRPRRVAVPGALLPARASTILEPVGVLLVIAPWNYPVQLLLAPLVGALAAGNAVVLKPSELAPATSAAMARLIPQYLDTRAVAVVEGGVEDTTDLLAQRWDHIFYTGNGRVGRIVAAAAVENLTPVTLELGGKSPVYVDSTVDLAAAARRIAWGKFMNAGQTCVAPDYVLVPRGKEQAFIERARVCMAKMYPGIARNPDYTSIISPRHFERLQRLADEAQAAGAQLHPLTDSAPDAASRCFPPVAVTNVPPECALMEEEIFGPLLPIVPYDTLDDAIAWINARPRPLALYLYADDAATIDRVTHETIAGGMAINETLMHLACESLPFGGVGASGMGAYHGYEGFVTFSKMKPVLTQARLNARGWIAPPYGKRVNALLKLMMRF